MYPWKALSTGCHILRLQVYWTCACLWQVWDGYGPKPPCAVQTNVECSARLREFSRHGRVPHCCNGSSIAKMIWHQRSSCRWSLMALMVAHSFFKCCFNLAWSIFAELEVICPFRGEQLAWLSLVGEAEQGHWEDCLEKQELPSKPHPQVVCRKLPQFAGIKSTYARYQEMVEKSHLNKSLWSVTRPDSGKVALTHVRCCGTLASRQSHGQQCIHAQALCLHAGVSDTPVLRSYRHLCLPLPVLLMYIPALNLLYTARLLWPALN